MKKLHGNEVDKMKEDVKMLRHKLMNEHLKLVKKGEYNQARLILRLLRRGKIKLGLGDDCWAVEMICEDIGCHINYSSNGYSATVLLKGGIK